MTFDAANLNKHARPIEIHKKMLKLNKHFCKPPYHHIKSSSNYCQLSKNQIIINYIGNTCVCFGSKSEIVENKKIMTQLMCKSRCLQTKDRAVRISNKL